MDFFQAKIATESSFRIGICMNLPKKCKSLTLETVQPQVREVAKINPQLMVGSFGGSGRIHGLWGTAKSLANAQAELKKEKNIRPAGK